MEYKNIIFTDHALKRMKLRKISQDAIVRTIKDADRKEKESDGDTKFIKTINKREIHVVANYQQDEKKWLVKSTWVRGEDDPVPLWWRVVTFPFQFFNRR